jgi:hypothetical protein
MKVPMEEECVLKLVFDKYDCNFSEAVQRGYAVHVRDCLKGIAAAIRL